MPPWTVLLIGGASGVGKTQLSQPLARRLGVNLTEVDDIQIALEAATTSEQLPLLHYWRTHLDEFVAWDEERRVAHVVRVCREVFGSAMRAVIADHLETGVRVVFEGDFLLPELVTGDGVRGLFVSERDSGQIAANYGTREGGATIERARTSAAFDAFLRGECVRHGVPVVAARPWATVVDRALATLGDDA